jgi:hypothetical protein
METKYGFYSQKSVDAGWYYMTFKNDKNEEVKVTYISHEPTLKNNEYSNKWKDVQYIGILTKFIKYHNEFKNVIMCSEKPKTEEEKRIDQAVKNRIESIPFISEKVI